MSLNVSENVREVLKGTLLISRRTVCMPISTVQRLISSFCEEMTKSRGEMSKQSEVSNSEEINLAKFRPVRVSLGLKE